MPRAPLGLKAHLLRRLKYLYFLLTNPRYLNGSFIAAASALNYNPSYYRWCKRGMGKLWLSGLRLNSESIVFDVGGYDGYSTERLISTYNVIPRIFIFEPIPLFYEKIQKKFDNSRITVLNYGLSDHDHETAMCISGMGSTIYRTSQKMIPAKFRDIASVIQELKVPEIDLIKINIEGGEYVLLKKMIDDGLIANCKNLLIQFHEWYPNAPFLREQILKEIALTHRPVFVYPFVWERWALKTQDTAESDEVFTGKEIG